MENGPELNESLRMIEAARQSLARPATEEPQAATDPAYEESLDTAAPEMGSAYDELADLEDDDPAVLEATLRELIREEAQEMVRPLEHQAEMGRRAAAIQALAEQYPRLREPEVAAAIDQRVKELATRYGNPHLATDPVLVEQLYQAMEARERAAAEVPASAIEGGAVLEQGAGPAPAPDPQTAAERAYDSAIMGMVGTDPLTS